MLSRTGGLDKAVLIALGVAAAVAALGDLGRRMTRDDAHAPAPPAAGAQAPLDGASLDRLPAEEGRAVETINAIPPAQSFPNGTILTDRFQPDGPQT